MKKRNRKKPVRISKKSPEQIKVDLKFFEKGVVRLKELERELNQLDTRGFSKEERTIRAKLKNVSDIPAIEKEIKVLRLKINKKYKPKIRKKKSPVVRELKELNKNVKKLIKKKRVDKGVGDTVNSEFGEFLDDVKGKLSFENRKKQREMKKFLKRSLAEKNKEFKIRQAELENDYEEKKRKLESSLKKREISLNKKSRERVKKKLEELKSKFKSKKKVEKTGKKVKVKKMKKTIKKIGKIRLSLTDKAEIEREVRAIENRINKQIKN